MTVIASWDFSLYQLTREEVSSDLPEPAVPVTKIMFKGGHLMKTRLSKLWRLAIDSGHGLIVFLTIVPPASLTFCVKKATISPRSLSDRFFDG